MISIQDTIHTAKTKSGDRTYNYDCFDKFCTATTAGTCTSTTSFANTNTANHQCRKFRKVFQRMAVLYCSFTAICWYALPWCSSRCSGVLGDWTAHFLRRRCRSHSVQSYSNHHWKTAALRQRTQLGFQGGSQHTGKLDSERNAILDRFATGPTLPL